MIGFLFAATGPVAIILSVAKTGGLGTPAIESWLFGAFFLNGLLTIGFCWLLRQPLVFLWTIPGTVLIGPALSHLGFPEVIGAYIATGLLVFMLGATGWIAKIMDFLPMPIVMGMVAGVFLRFGLDLVHAAYSDPWIAFPMIFTFMSVSALAFISRRLPPILPAIIVGVVMCVSFGRLSEIHADVFRVVRPILYTPSFSFAAITELVVPLAITVVGVHNSQGIAILKAANHKPPVSALTMACGIGSVVTALVGAVSTCFTGPVNAIISASGLQKNQYKAGITVGVLSLLFGLFAPPFVAFMLAVPGSFIACLAGLAVLNVLAKAFAATFIDQQLAIPALCSLLVTLSDIQILNIGPPFWAIVVGTLIAKLNRVRP